VKKRLARALNEFLAPIRERRARFAVNPRYVEEVVVGGSRVARREAQETLRLCLEKMGMNYFGAVHEDV